MKYTCVCNSDCVLIKKLYNLFRRYLGVIIINVSRYIRNDPHAFTEVYTKLHDIMKARKAGSKRGACALISFSWEGKVRFSREFTTIYVEFRL